MEHAPLRPVPGRPRGPVSDADAVREVAAALPAIGAREGLALALVALVGRTRAEVAPRVGLDEEALGQALVAARKELRRTLTPLPGSGWCERAERLISDRLDGALAERDVLRLDVHLRNCPRCVEHERRLVQATDGLMTSLTARPAPPGVALVDVAEREPPGAPATAEPATAQPEAAEPAAAQPQDATTAATRADSAGAAGAGAADPTAVDAVAPDSHIDRGRAEPPLVADVSVSRSLREVAVGFSWRFLFVLAVSLAIASLALALAGLLGTDL